MLVRLTHMTSTLDTSSGSRGDRHRARAYLRDFLPGMALYLVMVPAVLAWGDLRGAHQLRLVWALAPLVPALWTVWAIARHLRRVDEYQQRLLLSGVAIGFAAAMVACVGAGFLALAGVAQPFPGASIWFVFAVGMVGMAVGAAVTAGRS